MTSLEAWIVEQGLNGSTIAALLSGFSERMAADGVVLARAYLALPTVNPTVRVYNHSWTPSSGGLVEGVSHERNEEEFERSPIGHMLRAGLTKCHWRFDTPNTEHFEIFDDVKDVGGTDYLARLIRFENSSAPGLRGVAATFSAGRPGGFLP